MKTKQLSKIALFTICVSATVLAIGGLFLTERFVPIVAAQSTGDSLPTRTPTSQPTPTQTVRPTSPATTAPRIWVGRLVSNTLGVTEGNGSIFRVKVADLIGVPIELRLDDQVITAVSGSKAEYGPYAAEFAPVTEGTWTVSVPSLGASLQVTADNYNLAVIEFVQIPVPEATKTAEPTVTPTPLGGQIWVGRLASETAGSGVNFGRLLVQVLGRNGQPVQLSTPLEFINTAHTGQKPDELGPYMVEFTGLTPAKYIIEPLGLNTQFEVELKANIVTRVEFQALQPTSTATPTPTVTPLPPTVTPLPTMTPPPTQTPSPAVTPTPPATATPLPLPTPVTRWLGAIAEREDKGTSSALIAVRVAAVEGVPIRLRSSREGINYEKRCLTGQNSVEKDLCTFEDVDPGDYVISLEGLGLTVPVTLTAGERVLVSFELEVLPPGISGWQVSVAQNSNGIQAAPDRASIIRIRIDSGRVGQVVALRSARGTEKFCESTKNPLLDGLFCEFDQLGPGVYLVEVLHTGASRRVFVDGRGQIELIFSPNATQTSQTLVGATPIVGQGAQPKVPTVTLGVTLVVTPVPTQRSVALATPTRRPPPTLTPSPTSTLTPSPTPAFAWQGRVVERVDNVAGTIGVRAAGLDKHPVILRSGGWQTGPQLTGNKPELGLYSTEFGGLAQGEYIVELVDLAEIKVVLKGDQFLLVEFRFDFIDPP